MKQNRGRRGHSSQYSFHRHIPSDPTSFCSAPHPAASSLHCKHGAPGWLIKHSACRPLGDHILCTSVHTVWFPVQCFYRVPKCANEWVSDFGTFSWALCFVHFYCVSFCFTLLYSALLLSLRSLFVLSYYILFYYYPLEAFLFSNER